MFGRYNLLFALTTALVIGAAAGFNFVVDPYGVWRAVEKPGFNVAKSE